MSQHDHHCALCIQAEDFYDHVKEDEDIEGEDVRDRYAQSTLNKSTLDSKHFSLF